MRWLAVGPFCPPTSVSSASRCSRTGRTFPGSTRPSRKEYGPSSSTVRGIYQIVPTASGADAVLSGAITGFASQQAGLTISSWRPAIRFTVTMRVQFTDTRNSQVLWSNEALTFRDEYDLRTRGTAQVEGAVLLEQEGPAFDRLSTRSRAEPSSPRSSRRSSLPPITAAALRKEIASGETGLAVRTRQAPTKSRRRKSRRSFSNWWTRGCARSTSTVFTAARTRAGQVIDTANTMPMMVPRRVVVVHGGGEAAHSPSAKQGHGGGSGAADGVHQIAVPSVDGRLRVRPARQAPEDVEAAAEGSAASSTAERSRTWRTLSGGSKPRHARAGDVRRRAAPRAHRTRRAEHRTPARRDSIG